MTILDVWTKRSPVLIVVFLLIGCGAENRDPTAETGEIVADTEERGVETPAPDAIAADAIAADAIAPDAVAPDAVARAAIASDVTAVLQRQVEAWNRGSLRDFMEGYAQTDTLRFASGGNVRRGWDETLRRYELAYADEDIMGTLDFSNLEIWPLSTNYAVVFGQWDLQRAEAYGNAGGLFTLVFERGPDGWRIVHDHTSARD